MTKAIAILSLLARLDRGTRSRAEPRFRFGVARVSYVSGDVSYQRGDDDGWADARINTPRRDGRLASALEGGSRRGRSRERRHHPRWTADTEVDLVNNSTDVAQLGLNEALLDLSAALVPLGVHLELDTPTGAATILEPGRIPFRTCSDPRHRLLRGARQPLARGRRASRLDVREGESLVARGTDPPRYGTATAERTSVRCLGRRTGIARWTAFGDQRYVNQRGRIGYEDLDEHGAWRDSREYGRVWIPSGFRPAGLLIARALDLAGPVRMDVGSYEPWGWAPYHYGRWVYVGSDWCWIPPPPAC